MTAHAKLSASGAHRWMACPGSVQAEEGLADRSSSFAEEGTRAHEVMEECLINGEDAKDFCDDAEMADAVQIYLDYVRAIPADIRAIETRVDFSDWVPEGFGTADTVIIKDRVIHIVDLKYGKGVRVDAPHNPQAMLYALGAYSAYGFFNDFDTVRISIVQPRLDHISEWEITLADLLKWGETVSQAAAETKDPKAKRNPGEKQCRFCKAKAMCPALAKFARDTIAADFDAIEEAEAPNKLPGHRLAEILAAKPLIEAWLSAVEAEAKKVIASGGDLPGFKLVEGRSNRKWIDDEVKISRALRPELEADLFVTKLITPAQADKLLGKKNRHLLDGLTIKPTGAATIVPESDPRPPIGSSALDFDTILDGE